MLHWSMPKTGMKLAVVSNLFYAVFFGNPDRVSRDMGRES